MWRRLKQIKARMGRMVFFMFSVTRKWCYHVNNVHSILEKLPLLWGASESDWRWYWFTLNLKSSPVFADLRRYSRVNHVTARVSIRASIGLSIVLPWLSWWIRWWSMWKSIQSQMKMVVFKRCRFTQGKNDDDLGDVEEDCIFHIEHGCCCCSNDRGTKQGYGWPQLMMIWWSYDRVILWWWCYDDADDHDMMIRSRTKMRVTVYWRSGMVLTVIPTMDTPTNAVEIIDTISAAFEDSECSIRSHNAWGLHP